MNRERTAPTSRRAGGSSATTSPSSRARGARLARRWVAVALVPLALGCLLALLPLKRVEPFVVRVDNATGGVDIVTVLRDAPQSYGEAVDKYFLNKYVLSRESYDWRDRSRRPTTPRSSSRVPTSSGSSARSTTAQRPGTRSSGTTSGTREGPLHHARQGRRRRPLRANPPRRGRSQDVDESLVATIGYQYVAAPMHEEDRLVNPLGFQVTSYRVDPETVRQVAGTTDEPRARCVYSSSGCPWRRPGVDDEPAAGGRIRYVDYDNDEVVTIEAVVGVVVHVVLDPAENVRRARLRGREGLGLRLPAEPPLPEAGALRTPTRTSPWSPTGAATTSP